ncbi:type II toxin-antitoxin system HipA family toxin [Gilvimarinus polysaccharolyticus]|uniref:type II toxin-antitoxin system HipA family toxin n=1 Tax=Gilvimarinus polysaccharolyticus TaxID=863921 RepID=UPI00067337E7|nr:HipA domain-containing protein [Gilvimarinus polysaccharolyticus]
MAYQSAYVFARLANGERRLAGTITCEPPLAEFVYSQHWLSEPTAYPLDPVNLPLVNRTFRTQNPKGTFGVFTDAGPDDWGTRIMLMHHNSSPHNEVERLLRTSGGGVGLLEFSLSRSYPRAPAPLPDIQLLNELAAVAQKVQAHEPLTPEQLALIEPGSSMGGARPKVVVCDASRQWLVKFSRQQDLVNIPTLEFLTMELLREAGCCVPATMLRELGGGHSAFLIERFDRVTDQPLHFVSANSLFNTSRLRMVRDSRKNPYSYINLAAILRKHSAEPVADCRELFIRMLCNILLGNTDDHARNHAMTYSVLNRQWRLSPLYDVLPTLGGVRGHQAMGVGIEGADATLSNARSLSKLFYFNDAQAQAEIDRLLPLIATLPARAAQAGMASDDVHILKGVLNLPAEANGAS